MHEIILTALCALFGAAAILVGYTLIRLYDLCGYLDRRAQRRAESLQVSRRLRGLRIDHRAK